MQIKPQKVKKFYHLGVLLRYIDNKVYVQCLSDKAIFVQSRNCNKQLSLHANTVCKVPKDASLCIFDNILFARLLGESVEKDYQSVFELTKMGTIR